jgi:hypothetical protein
MSSIIAELTAVCAMELLPLLTAIRYAAHGRVPNAAAVFLATAHDMPQLVLCVCMTMLHTGL